jgi:hypothetical protein
MRRKSCEPASRITRSRKVSRSRRKKSRIAGSPLAW